MTKKNSSPSSTRRKKLTASELVKSIAELDRRILRLCNDRAQLLLNQVTPDQLTRVLDGRRQKSWRKLLNNNPGPINEAGVRAIFRELDSAARAVVTTTRVAFLGPEFSYSHLAAIERFGQSTQLVPVTSISAVFEAVNRKEVQYGIVPVENSTDGRIADSLDMFSRLPVRICGEVPMRIHHNLLAKCELTKIKEVHSKPQALSQCRDWLQKNLPNARPIATSSTTAAAENAAKNLGVAAIASCQAGANYRLDVMATNIEDNPNNLTRFAVIGENAAPSSGNDKTSLMFELAHQPGALADAMNTFKRNQLNLTWIESFPKQGSPNEYLFFVELDGHQTDSPVRQAIMTLEKKTVRIETLGSYAKMKPIG
ncbi:MAG: prephenate dehydratase [Pirellulaceae bacterium]|nr:prephenate dehydratase [Pirellulaceae bacterium]